MSGLARRLRREGYDVANWGYRSTRGSVESHARTLESRFLKFTQQGRYFNIHLVTHSMGSILARTALANGSDVTYFDVEVRNTKKQPMRVRVETRFLRRCATSE